MKLIKNSGTDRVLDILRSSILPGSVVEIATSELSLFAFAEFRDLLAKCSTSRLIVPDPARSDLGWLGGVVDRGTRNKLQAR